MQNGFFALSKLLFLSSSHFDAASTFCNFSIRSAVAKKGLGKGGNGATIDGTVYLTPKASRMRGVRWAVEPRILGMP